MQNYEKKWISDISQLFDLRKVLDILPDDFNISTLSSNKSFNELSRFIILVGIFSYIRCKDQNIILYTIIFLMFFIMIHSQCGIATSKKSSPETIATTNNFLNINNPFNNRTPYTDCGNKRSIEDIGLNNSNPILRSTNPSSDEIMMFQKSFQHNDNSYENISEISPEIKHLQEQKINGMFRQFLSLPGNDCVENQTNFAEILYGKPDDLIYKQKNLDNFAMK